MTAAHCRSQPVANKRSRRRSKHAGNGKVKGPTPMKPTPAASVPAPAAPAGPPAPSLEFLWKVHSYTNDYIRFADTKAGIALALVAGLLATLFGSKAHYYLAPSRLALPTETE